MFPFFDGLIPEGWLLSVALDNWKLDAKDRMGLLGVACRDTIGAVALEKME
jgi:serine/threonine-protein kinase HipA